MNASEIIEHIYKSGFLKYYIYKIGFSKDRENIDDIVQDIVYMMLKHPKIYEELYSEGGMERCLKYTSGIVYRQIKSLTSPIYYTYKKKDEVTISLDALMETNEI